MCRYILQRPMTWANCLSDISCCRNCSSYALTIKNNVEKLSTVARKQRDSTYEVYSNLRLYRTLYIDKVVDADYIPLVNNIGYVLINRKDSSFNLLARKINKGTNGKDTFLCSEVDSFLCCAAYLDFRGGYIPEFQDLVNRYVNKYGYYYGQDNNLYYSQLYINPTDREALDAIGQLCKHWSKKSNDRISNSYVHPQFVYYDEYINYLKLHYPDSKQIPPPPLPIQILQKSVKYESMMSGYYVYCRIKNNTDKLVKYLDLNATFYNSKNTIVGTGMGNTMNLAAGAERTVTLIAPQIDEAANFEIQVENVLYQ
jgi:hypothetical protein